MIEQTPTADATRRAAAALLEFMRSPENPSKWRILETRDYPVLERLAQAAGRTVEIHYLNLSTGSETTRLIGPTMPPSS